jgi:hypothetical protein
MTNDGENELNFRDSKNRLTIESKMIRDNGRHRCGYNLVKSRSVPTDAPSLIASAGVGSQSAEGDGPSYASNTWVNQMPREFADYITHSALHEISLKVRERVTDNNSDGLPATGTIENIDAWAEKLCKDDKEQRKAFRNIVSNYVLQFHAEATANDLQSNQSRQKKKKLNNIRKDLEAVNPKMGKQLICFLTGAGGSGKSNIIKGKSLNTERNSVRALKWNLQNVLSL